MTISFGSVCICILIIFFLYLYLQILLNANSKFFIEQIRIIFIGIIFLCIRTLLPFNFPFTITIPVKYGLTKFTDHLLNIPIKGYSFFEGFVWIWFLGCVLKIFILLLKYYKFKIVIYQAASINHFRKKQISSLLEKYTNKNFRIAIIPSLISPAISGIKRPILIMPDYDYSNEDLNYIISHEVTHYKKHDLVLKLFLEICVCLYWWNPLMYLFKAKFCLAVEIANDISIIKNESYTCRLNYIKCLVLNSRLSSEKKLDKSICSSHFEIPFMKSSKDLKVRCKKIINYTEIQSFRIFGFISKSILIVSLMSGLIFVPECYYIDPHIEKTTFSINAVDSYLVKTYKGYDLFVNNKYIATISDIDDTFKDLKIYQEGKK